MTFPLSSAEKKLLRLWFVGGRHREEVKPTARRRKGKEEKERMNECDRQQKEATNLDCLFFLFSVFSRCSLLLLFPFLSFPPYCYSIHSSQTRSLNPMHNREYRLSVHVFSSYHSCRHCRSSQVSDAVVVWGMGYRWPGLVWLSQPSHRLSQGFGETGTVEYSRYHSCVREVNNDTKKRLKTKHPEKPPRFLLIFPNRPLQTRYPKFGMAPLNADRAPSKRTLLLARAIITLLSDVVWLHAAQRPSHGICIANYYSGAPRLSRWTNYLTSFRCTRFTLANLGQTRNFVFFFLVLLSC